MKEKKKITENLGFLYVNYDDTINEIEDISKFFDIKNLFNKYNISQPLDPLKEFIKIQRLKIEINSAEEIYYLFLLISFCYYDSKIKYFEKMKQRLEKTSLIKSNIIKKNLIKIFIEKINNISQVDLINKIWNDSKKGGEFVEDKEMNQLIKRYMKEKNVEDYKKDLTNLITPI